MENLRYEHILNATPEKVWESLWEDSNYKKWTKVFSEGSYAVSDWKEGSSIHFLNPDGRGMYSVISKLVPNEKMHFTHIGDIIDFKEVPVDENSYWNGFTENYDLEDMGGKTKFIAQVQINEDHKEFFLDAFPKALAIVKEIAES